MKSFRGKPILNGPIQKGQNSPTRIHIANLARALNTFIPVLVNENGEPIDVPFNEEPPEGSKWTGAYKVNPNVPEGGSPNMDQLINTAFGAMQEIGEFIQAHEKLKTQVTVFRDDLTASYQIAHASGVKCDTMEGTVATFAARWKQAIDIITKLTTATPHNEARIKAAASEYITRIVPGQLAGLGLSGSLAAVPEPETQSGGTNGADTTVGQ